MMISRCSSSAFGKRPRAVPSLSPQYALIPWMFCALAASRKPRSALAASAAPVPAPVIVVVAGAVFTVFVLVERQAAKLLITSNPTHVLLSEVKDPGAADEISFFIQLFPWSGALLS